MSAHHRLVALWLDCATRHAFRRGRLTNDLRLRIASIGGQGGQGGQGERSTDAETLASCIGQARMGL